MSKRKLARGVSGNPARRAESRAIAQRFEMAADLWPFAFDYYTQSHRVGIFADVPVVETEAGKAVDLHGTTTVPLGELGDRVGADRFAVVVTVGERNGKGVQVLCSPAPDFDAALVEVLTDLTSLFMEELGADAGPYIQSALRDRPVLGSPSAARDLLLPLIVYPGDNWHLEDGDDS